MKRLVAVAVLALAMLVPAGAAFAGPVVGVGNCAKGEIFAVRNNNPTTGYTEVYACYP